MTTICFIYGNNEDGWKFGFMRIRFVKAGSEPVLNMDGFYDCFEVESSFEEIGYSAISTKLTFELVDSEINSTDDVYFGAIYSRKSANGWLRSTSYITVPDGTELQPDYETALATYPQGTGYILNGAIISNGGRVKPQPTPIGPRIVSVTPQLPTDNWQTVNVMMSEDVSKDDVIEHLNVKFTNGSEVIDAAYVSKDGQDGYRDATLPPEYPTWGVAVNGNKITLTDNTAQHGYQIYSVEWV